jgi:hypothetical protein
MQQLKIEHENTTAKKDRRSGKGRVIALSRRIYRLMQTEDVFYVESESTDNVYYFVKFKPDLTEWCSCRDNSTRGLKCKHLWSIEFAIKFDTLKEIDKLPADVKRDTSMMMVSPKPEQIAATIEAKSYTNDDYSF